VFVSRLFGPGTVSFVAWFDPATTFSPGANDKMAFRLRSRVWVSIVCFLLCLSGAVASAQTYTITPSCLTFTGTGVGLQSITKGVTIFNTGTTSLTVSSYSVSSQFILIYGWAPYVIAPGKNFAFGVRFAPNVVGTTSGQITLVINGANVVVPLTGTALTTNAKASVLPASLHFGTVPVGTISTPQTLTIKNIGTSAMKVETVTADAPFSVSGFSGSVITLRAGQSLSLQVTLTGTAAQPLSDLLTIGFDVVPEIGVPLTGNGTGPTSLGITTFSVLPSATVVAPYLATFTAAGGTPPYTWSVAQGSSLPAGLTLSNSGTVTGTLASTVTTGSYPFTVQVTDSSSSQNSSTVTMTLPVGPQPGSNCNNISWNVKGTTTPIVPLTDLGTGTYQGYQGGLYPNGSNTRPAQHDADGVAIGQSIVPLDANGNYDPNGKYGLLSIGLSVTFDTFVMFESDMMADPNKNSHLVFVPGAQPRAEASLFADPNNGVWTPIFESFLPQAGITANQVVAAWVDEVDTTVSGTFPSDVTNVQAELETIAQNLHAKFPNLQLVYFGSRLYGAYSNNTGRPPQDPEPFAYESGFAAKWAIQDQINGNANLNYNAANGAVMAPWMGWGAYTWANGLLARSDGTVWGCQDIQFDGTHVSNPVGRQKEANLMMQFFQSDTTSSPWFLAPPVAGVNAAK
jgi:hypothetical protein